MNLMTLIKGGDAAAIQAANFTVEELNARDESGRTALMHAAIIGDYRVVDVLKKLGADVDMVDNDGRKAVHLAAKYGKGTAIIYLIEGGCGG